MSRDGRTIGERSTLIVLVALAALLAASACGAPPKPPKTVKKTVTLFYGTLTREATFEKPSLAVAIEDETKHYVNGELTKYGKKRSSCRSGRFRVVFSGENGLARTVNLAIAPSGVLEIPLTAEVIRAFGKRAADARVAIENVDDEPARSVKFENGDPVVPVVVSGDLLARLDAAGLGGAR